MGDKLISQAIARFIYERIKRGFEGASEDDTSDYFILYHPYCVRIERGELIRPHALSLQDGILLYSHDSY